MRFAVPLPFRVPESARTEGVYGNAAGIPKNAKLGEATRRALSVAKVDGASVRRASAAMG